MDWDKLRIFHAVASAGSFTHAGQMLGLSQSAVSRQISALEDEISTPLFQRHARGLTLTDEGELLFTAVTDVLARLAAAEEALKNVHDSPRGTLKITASHGIGAYWLLPRLGEFLSAISGGGTASGDGRPRTGSGPARGRPGHPHARAGAGRPDPAQAVHRALSHVRVEGVSEGTSRRPSRWTRSPTTPSSSMARPRRRKSATSTGCWSITRKHRQAGQQGPHHPHQQHHRHPAGGGSGPGDRRGARLCRRPASRRWCGCCPTCRRRASTCIWSMPMPCASPSAWRRSATSR